MKCLFPISLERPHGGSPTDRIQVPCGRCAGCMTNRREGWIIRLLEEYKIHDKAVFITLTYNDENLIMGEYPTLYKPHAVKFIKDLRHRISGKIKFYLVGEYGTHTKRPHLHAILFNVSADDEPKILKVWAKGNVTVAPCNIKTITYTTKYHVNKTDFPSGTSPPFALMSKNLGMSYVEKFKDYHKGNTMRGYYQHWEFKKPLPRYYKQKLYTRGEIATIGKQQLDKYDILEDMKRFSYEHPNDNFWQWQKMLDKTFQENFKNKNKNDKL